jgi:hypothetical protein
LDIINMANATPEAGGTLYRFPKISGLNGNAAMNNKGNARNRNAARLNNPNAGSNRACVNIAAESLALLGVSANPAAERIEGDTYGFRIYCHS